MIVRISFLVLAFAATLVASTSRKKKKTIRKAVESGTSLHAAENEEEKNAIDEYADYAYKISKHGEEEGDRKLDMILSDFKNAVQTEEIRMLQKEYEQRKLTLEGKLLRLYCLKENQLFIAQLGRSIEAKAAEIDLLKTTISSLRIEKTELLEELKQNLSAETMLWTARKKIKDMEAQLTHSSNVKVKGKLMKIGERVCGIQMEGVSSLDDVEKKKLGKVKDVERELVKAKRTNKELQLEKRELTIRLETLLARIALLSNDMIESTTLIMLEKEIHSLRNTNEELLNHVEMLQKNRFSMVEELVYQRWLNACLKFEIHKYHNPSSSNRKSHRKIKPSESTNKSCSDSFLSSPASSGDTKEFDTSNSYSSSTSHRRIHMKLSLLKKIRSWRSKNKEESARNVSLGRRSLMRRFSTSMIRNENSGQGVQDSIQQAPRKRRVSFNDLVKTFPSGFQEDVELSEGECLEEKENG